MTQKLKVDGLKLKKKKKKNFFRWLSSFEHETFWIRRFNCVVRHAVFCYYSIILLVVCFFFSVNIRVRARSSKWISDWAECNRHNQRQERIVCAQVFYVSNFVIDSNLDDFVLWMNCRQVMHNTQKMKICILPRFFLFLFCSVEIQ